MRMAALPKPPGSQRESALKRITSRPKKAQARSLELQDIIYNSAPELRSLAFKSGYNLGAEAYGIAGNGGLSALEHLLEHAGMGKLLYHPFDSMSTFTSYASKSYGENLGLNAHVFEAGLISGYLSAHVGQNVGVQETACKFNGSSHCMFVARTGSAVNADAYKRLALPEVLLALRYAILRAGKHSTSKSYYLLAMKPLMEEPVFSEASRFLYLAGKLLIKQFPAEPDRTITRAADFLMISSAKMSSSKRNGRTLSLSYDHETSSGRFVDLTTAFISGLIKGAYGGGTRMTRIASSRGVYNVKLEIMQSGSK